MSNNNLQKIFKTLPGHDGYDLLIRSFNINVEELSSMKNRDSMRFNILSLIKIAASKNINAVKNINPLLSKNVAFYQKIEDSLKDELSLFIVELLDNEDLNDYEDLISYISSYVLYKNNGFNISLSNNDLCEINSGAGSSYITSLINGDLESFNNSVSYIDCSESNFSLASGEKTLGFLVSVEEYEDGMFYPQYSLLTEENETVFTRVIPEDETSFNHKLTLAFALALRKYHS